MKYRLVKSEPETYSWEQLEKDGKAVWDGVRNYAARLNLNAMKKGDKVLFYHSNVGLEIVGCAEVLKEAYPDPTTDDDRWVAVDIKPVKALKKPVSLKALKEDTLLRNMQFVKIGRLSVSAVTPEEFKKVLQLADTKI